MDYKRDKLEQFSLTYSRCATRDVTSLLLVAVVCEGLSWLGVDLIVDLFVCSVQAHCSWL